MDTEYYTPARVMWNDSRSGQHELVGLRIDVPTSMPDRAHGMLDWGHLPYMTHLPAGFETANYDRGRVVRPNAPGEPGYETCLVELIDNRSPAPPSVHTFAARPRWARWKLHSIGLIDPPVSPALDMAEFPSPTLTPTVPTVSIHEPTPEEIDAALTDELSAIRAEEAVTEDFQHYVPHQDHEPEVPEGSVHVSLDGTELEQLTDAPIDVTPRPKLVTVSMQAPSRFSGVLWVKVFDTEFYVGNTFMVRHPNSEPDQNGKRQVIIARVASLDEDGRPLLGSNGTAHVSDAVYAEAYMSHLVERPPAGHTEPPAVTPEPSAQFTSEPDSDLVVHPSGVDPGPEQRAHEDIPPADFVHSSPDDPHNKI